MKPSLRAALATVVLLAPLALATPAHAANTLSMLGADVSSLQRSLDHGARDSAASGAKADP